jgi:branched-chain amino acid transport system ATP-binding protein
VTALSVRALTKSYGGVRALRDVSFHVSAGELVAMIGPNGAGKTTCFDVLGGQASADAGVVQLDGQSLSGMTPRQIWRLGVGRTFQITATFGSMTVRENVQTALLSHRRRLWSMMSLAARAHAAEADALLARVGILQHAHQPCALLAYGDLKRVELAMALANRPRLLLMDEPTAGMAPQERGALMRLAAALAREGGTAVLFTEHDMDVVFTHADRVLVLVEGELIAQGSPAAVRANAQVRETYLGSGNA